MLAQNFKTAADLGISDKEHRSLVQVLGMFERGEISREQFHMRSIEDWCGSRACIMGWCQRVAGDDVFNKPVASVGQGFDQLYHGLFMFSDKRRFNEGDPQHAALAIRSYLTTGDPRWDLAVA